MKQAVFVPTPVGRIGIAEEGNAITNVFFGGTVQPKAYREAETPLLRRAAEQLLAYFAGTRRAFDLPLAPEGTLFERQVWQTLGGIPYGEIRTYSQIALQLGRPAACRAVGRANSRNPISIFLPCHRVIGKNGALTGYAGGLEMKRVLLELEGVSLAADGKRVLSF